MEILRLMNVHHAMLIVLYAQVANIINVKPVRELIIYIDQYFFKNYT